MRPAFSIVLFTTSSGAGFALLLLLGLGAPLGLVPASSAFGFVGLAVATVLAGAGLVASAFHLGHPERAWRAFSQWRSSWLSREGVFSVLTFVPAAVFGIGWVFFGVTGRFVGLCGILTAALAAATVYCTGMIYASLKPIHQWHNGWVVPGYLALGLMGGCLVLDFLVRLWSRHFFGIALSALLVVCAGWWIKERYWRFIDTTSSRRTVAGATALGSRGRVRLLEAPHTGENYLLNEMGFRLARKHARRLRLIARWAGFAWPATLSFLGLFVGGAGGAVAAGLAVIGASVGLLAERWLFFAEAKHTLMLYYGAEAV
jgi:sulfite dehydrogenase (quinone) subunit SoeC